MAPVDSKPSNPKDLIGSDKIPFHLWPETASALGALGLLDGAMKYGRANFRAVGVRASIYYDALRRHANKWFEGEDVDPDSGLPHLAHALACLAILVDASAAGKLTDDRQYPGGYVDYVEQLTPHVKRIKEKYRQQLPAPHHYMVGADPEYQTKMRELTEEAEASVERIKEWAHKRWVDAPNNARIAFWNGTEWEPLNGSQDPTENYWGVSHALTNLRIP